jgi:hypothetical protein
METIYFIYSLFNDALSSSYYTYNDKWKYDTWIGKDVERRGRGMI